MGGAASGACSSLCFGQVDLRREAFGERRRGGRGGGRANLEEPEGDGTRGDHDQRESHESDEHPTDNRTAAAATSTDGRLIIRVCAHVKKCVSARIRTFVRIKDYI